MASLCGNSLEPERPPKRFSLPWDLLEWTDPDTLRGWVMDAVNSLDWDNAAVVACLRGHPAYQPRKMLGLLTYAYTTGMFGSEEVATACARDKVFRALSEGMLPTAAGIVRFRREHRGLLQWCLGQVLDRAVRSRFGLDNRPLVPGLRQCLVESATERLDLARHLDREAHGV